MRMKNQAYLHPRGDRLVLPGLGRALISLRGLLPGDADAYRDHLLRLSPSERRARFHGAVSDQGILRFAGHVARRDGYGFGAFVGPKLRAVAELLPVADGRVAELAISVEHDWQQENLGKLLILCVVLAARRLGIAELHLDFMPDNAAMRALARDIGATISSGTEADRAVLRLPAPGAKSGLADGRAARDNPAP